MAFAPGRRRRGLSEFGRSDERKIQPGRPHPAASGRARSGWREFRPLAPNEFGRELAAFVESDEDAARLFAEARALDTVLSYAPEGLPGREIETRILAAASALRQDRGVSLPDSAALIGRRPDGTITRAFRTVSRPSLWGGAALLAASLVIGIFIGLTGEAVPALRGISMFASYDSEAGIALSGSLFEPSGLHEQGEL